MSGNVCAMLAVVSVTGLQVVFGWNRRVVVDDEVVEVKESNELVNKHSRALSREGL